MTGRWLEMLPCPDGDDPHCEWRVPLAFGETIEHFVNDVCVLCGGYTSDGLTHPWHYEQD